jgi:hypothetical protein
MKQRSLLVLLIVAALVLPLVAAERATFILRNGQRETGTLVGHGRFGHNLIDAQFVLGDMPGGTGDMKEKAFPQEEVVAIDFVEQAPSGQELNRLANAPGQQALAFRDGTVLFGRFENIAHGNTVIFEENGKRREFPTSQVARVYLDLPAARTAMNLPAGNAAGAPGVGTSGSTQGPAEQVEVRSTRQWTDTGIVVRRGDRVTFQASGTVTVARDAQASGPDGNGNYQTRGGRYPVMSAPVGALVGRVGNGRAFGIGTQAGPLTMPASGRLYLGVNDDEHEDNDGSFSVTVIPEKSADQPTGIFRRRR